MRYVAAYLLANLAGNANPDAAAIEKILSSVGVDFNKDLAAKVINELKGKNVEDLIKEGSTKLSAMPVASAAPAAGAAAAGKPAEAKKEEPSMNNFLYLFNSVYCLHRRLLAVRYRRMLLVEYT